MAYQVYASGPDDNSTYAEAWGANGGRGEYVGTYSRLVDAVDAAVRDCRANDIYAAGRCIGYVTCGEISTNLKLRPVVSQWLKDQASNAS